MRTWWLIRTTLLSSYLDYDWGTEVCHFHLQASRSLEFRFSHRTCKVDRGTHYIDDLLPCHMYDLLFSYWGCGQVFHIYYILPKLAPPTCVFLIFRCLHVHVSTCRICPLIWIRHHYQRQLKQNVVFHSMNGLSHCVLQYFCTSMEVLVVIRYM